MSETSGKAKVKTAISHLESAENLLGSLPKYITQDLDRKTKTREIIGKIIALQIDLKNLYKDELG